MAKHHPIFWRRELPEDALPLFSGPESALDISILRDEFLSKINACGTGPHSGNTSLSLGVITLDTLATPELIAAGSNVIDLIKVSSAKI